MAKFTNAELERIAAEVAEKKATEEAAKAAERQKKMITWMSTAQRADLIIVSSLMVNTDDFDVYLVDLLINHSCDLEIGFFIGCQIMKDKIDKLILISNMIKQLKEEGIQSSTTIDHLYEAISRFC